MARSQTILFMLLGRYLVERPAERPMAVASRTCVEALSRTGFSVHAARGALSRLVRRGYLERHKRGRQTYFSLTPRADDLLAEGGARLHTSPVRAQPDERWTLLSFSIPERQRSDRHSLRAALTWLGFAPMRNGLWLAPGAVDVAAVIRELGLEGNVEVFVGQPAPPTDLATVVATVWDLDAIAAGYETFVDRWRDDAAVAAHSPLAAQLLLCTDWRAALVDDPVLPPCYLPGDWPAQGAYELFRRRDAELAAAAEREFAGILEGLPLAGAAVPAGPLAR